MFREPILSKVHVSKVSNMTIQSGLQAMKLKDLKSKSPTDLLAFAEELGIENASSMRKQDMLFAILKELADRNVE
ncbi:MAG TPA: Rho termination factor N-terminal domain-containing protein, partial [Rhizomicrobium sp.]|nr:Rho termination factor N-terminal domain-containing protein [Rhizomicrobium sp.]